MKKFSLLLIVISLLVGCTPSQKLSPLTREKLEADIISIMDQEYYELTDVNRTYLAYDHSKNWVITQNDGAGNQWIRIVEDTLDLNYMKDNNQSLSFDHYWNWQGIDLAYMHTFPIYLFEKLKYYPGEEIECVDQFFKANEKEIELCYYLSNQDGYLFVKAKYEGEELKAIGENFVSSSLLRAYDNNLEAYMQSYNVIPVELMTVQIKDAAKSFEAVKDELKADEYLAYEAEVVTMSDAS